LNGGFPWTVKVHIKTSSP
jgi:hypothetical protein